jgi:hypothetical protein
MFHSIKPAVLAAALFVVTVPVAAHAALNYWPPAPSQPSTPSQPPPLSQSPSTVKLCMSGGAGKLLLTGPQFFQTKSLQGYQNGHLGQNGGPNTPATITSDCDSISLTATGPYTVTAEKNLKAPCYRTVNGDLVNPPTLNSAGALCPAKIDGIDVAFDSQPVAHVAADQIEFPVAAGQPVTITFNISDLRYFPCVSQPGPGTANQNDDNKVCEPTGSTRN